MRSTSGEHYVALDHVRAVAVMLVFSWHFMHGPRGYPVPFDGTPLWSPLVLFDEGHVGVALFMTLSGYLFAKLLDGRRVNYPLFFWNRLLRLMPLLLLVLAIHAVTEAIRARSALAAVAYLLSMVPGFVLPKWPNGGWSIAVELQFYLLLPAILLLLRAKPWCVGLLVASALIFRAAYHASTGEVQILAYFTIFGRIDQFVFGILAFHCRNRIPGLRYWAAAAAVTLIHLYWWFDQRGGFFLQPSFPSPSLIWVVLPTLEGLLFSILIAWYDRSFRPKPGLVSSLLSTIGEYSYSIYLLHFFFAFDVAAWIQLHLVDISNFYVAVPVSLAVLILVLPLGYLSHRFIERPFLMLRRPYIRATNEPMQATAE
ncbi:MAG: acyltransferase [Burkholderiaceae bacterium]|nr:acyltransferase [Burkholderiaceae bacterium]